MLPVFERVKYLCMRKKRKYQHFPLIFHKRFKNCLRSCRRQNLDQTKFKAFADDKLNVIKFIFSVFDGVEHIVGKRRNCLYKQFLLFPQCFQKASFPDVSKGVIVWEWVKKTVAES